MTEVTTRRRRATQEARRRLAEKQAISVYRPPRGNPERDQGEMARTADRLRLILR
jgi:hypothetical protein